MEVKSVYMDLQEGVKKGNVWKLESEAFKDPIEIKIGYENKELAEFKNRFDAIENKLQKHDTDVQYLYTNDKEDMMSHIKITDTFKEHKGEIDELREKIDSQNKEISSLYKVIADLKTMVETQSGTILHLQEEMKLIQKKITKQPMVFSDTTFISGHERVGLGILEVPSGEYLVIEKYLLLEPNEFVENHDGIKINKITVTDNQYIPMYNLFGGTPLDTPTAKVYWTLAFIPC